MSVPGLTSSFPARAAASFRCFLTPELAILEECARCKGVRRFQPGTPPGPWQGLCPPRWARCFFSVSAASSVAPGCGERRLRGKRVRSGRRARGPNTARSHCLQDTRRAPASLPEGAQSILCGRTVPLAFSLSLLLPARAARRDGRRGCRKNVLPAARRVLFVVDGQPFVSSDSQAAYISVCVFR